MEMIKGKFYGVLLMPNMERVLLLLINFTTKVWVASEFIYYVLRRIIFFYIYI